MAATMSSDVIDGPVLSLINKRLRALRKKVNRISQIEEAIAQGKTINKEQEDVLRSKPYITASIDELDKLRQPLSSAVAEEVSLAIQRRQLNNKEEEELGQNQVKRDHEIIEDLLNLVYFGSMFDVKPQSDYTSTMLTRTHERGCCLTYDTVTDDDTDMLGERDLDLISMVGGLVISRPVNSVLSHKNALQRCIEHAKLWIEKSYQPIDGSDLSVTYSSLREKLSKIMGSDYFTTTPEMKGPGEVAAAAASGNYGAFHVPVSVDAEEYEQQEEDAAHSEGNGTYLNQCCPTGENHKEEDVAHSEGNGTYDNQSCPVGENHKGDLEVENRAEVQSQKESSVKPQGEEGQNQGDVDSKEQQQYVGRRLYHNQRGGVRGGGGRRGNYYSNGGRGGGRFSGGRGGGGPYQNGRNNQYYDQHQPGNYFPRNFHSNSRGGRGGGGSGGTSYGLHDLAVQAANVPPAS
ncbi:hypothetical protein LguiB_016137 [Lonicera macranthoides]